MVPKYYSRGHNFKNLESTLFEDLIGTGVKTFRLYNYHYIYKFLCTYWHFWCSGSKEEYLLRHAPYFHFFAIISLLKRDLDFILTFIIPVPEGCFCTKSSCSREEVQNVKNLRTDNGQQVMREAHLNLRLRWAEI